MTIDVAAWVPIAALLAATAYAAKIGYNIFVSWFNYKQTQRYGQAIAELERVR